VLCYIPLFYLLIFYLFVLRVAIKIGRIPEYDNPDPNTVGFPIHRLIADKLFDIAVYAVAMFLILLFITLALKTFRVNKIHLIVLGLTIALMCFHIFLDPFFVWSLD
jgi:hypothetical protein